MKKKLISVIAVMVCVSVFVTNVFAYPISPNTYKMTTTPTEDLTDEESVVWESTQPTEDFAYSPAICVTESGRIVVSYDISGEKGEVKYSDDGGATWLQATMKDDVFLFARPFETESGLYLVARRYAASAEDGNGQLIMFKSEDNGQTWGDASVIDSGVWHSAPSEVVHLNGYIYMTWEAQDKAAAQATGGAGRGILAPVILRARETADLTVASNWTISDSEETYLSYYDAVGGNSYSKIDYMGIPFMHYRFGDNTNLMGWLEGNIVRITDPSHVLYDENAFYIYLRSTANTSDYANLMKIVENEDGTMTSELVTTPSGKTNLYVQLPGGQSKFYITYDEQEELYWLVSNVSTDSMEIDTTFDKGADTSRHEGPQDVRNELGLYYSSNAMDWNFAGIVSATDSINQARSYPSMVIDGNDLLVVSRSGDEDAQSAHNTNLITFHKIKNFRRLANEALISEEQENLVYSPDVLDDSSVKDTHTYITENGTTLVACSISDETSTTSKVLVKQEDGTYVETLSTGYKLGEPFEVDETIYVFGVADHKLVAFTSTNEGVAWNGPYAIDTTRDWYEAPTSVIVNDEQVMLALTEKQASVTAWDKYSNGAFAGTVERGDKVTITGKAAAYTSEKIDVKEGTKISFDVEFETIGTNLIQTGFALTDKADTYYYSGTSNSVAVELVSHGDSKMTAGHAYAVGGGRTSGNDSTEITTNRNDIVGTTYTIAFEKQASGWIMTATDNAGHTKEMTYTNTDIDAAFANGVYLVVGSNQANHVMSVSNLKVEQKLADATAVASTDVNKMHMASPVVMTASLSNSLVDKASWTYYEGGQSFANKIGNPYTNDKFDYFGLPYADKDIRTIGWSDLQLFEVHETDDIRHDNQLNSGETTGNLYGYMTLQNAGYDYAAFVKINTNTQKVEFFTPAGLNAEIVEEEMVLSKMPGGNNGFEIFWDETSSLYWLVTTEHTDSTSDSKETRVAIYYGTNAYDWRSAGVVAELSGDARVSAVVEGQQLVITAINDDVVQYTVPNFRELVGFSGLGDWSQIKVRNMPSSYSIVENKNLIRLSNYGAATCVQKVDVAEGTQISFKVKGTTLVAGQVFAVGLIDTYGSFPGRIDDSTYFTGNGVVASIATFSNNNGAVIRYASAETAKYNTNTTDFANEAGNSIPNTVAMTNNEITFTFTKRSQTISGVAYSWTIDWVEAKGNTTGSYNLKASDVPDNLFDNGAYIFAGCRTGGACVYEISDVTVTQPLVGDVNHDGEINILDIAAIDYGIRVPASVASYEKHVYNVDKDENVEIDYKDVNAIRADVLAH